MKRKEEEKTKRRGKKEKENKIRGMIVIPYVKGLSDAVSRVFRKHGVTTAIRPHRTLRRLLVHPKDKQDKSKVCECVYRIPCKIVRQRTLERQAGIWGRE